MSDPRNEGATDLPPEGVGATENEPKISPDTEAETDDQAECEPDGPPEWVLTPGVSRLAPRWWIKTLVFALVVGCGGWGLVDARVVYPSAGSPTRSTRNSSTSGHGRPHPGSTAPASPILRPSCGACKSAPAPRGPASSTP